MGQFINTNVASLNAQRQLNTSQGDLNTSLQRLSSGLRINSAKDDAAGLAISERFTSQIRGLNQAVRNANDGVSLAQTAEGALGANSGSLQRIRELAIQSANSTNSASDRKALNNEVSQLLAEVQRVGETTQFNGQNILDGTFTSAQFQVGANANQTISFGIAGATTNLLGAYQQTSSAVTSAALTGTSVTINGTAIGASVATSAAGVTEGSATAKATAINAQTSVTGVTATATNTVTGIGPIAGAGLANGVLVINDISIGAIAASGSVVTQGQNAATAINSASAQTGVAAVFDASSGALTLTASDGRDIKIETNDGLAPSITDLYNATGLLAGDTAPTSVANYAEFTFNAAVDVVASGGSGSNDITQGDTLTIDGLVYEFNSAANGATGSNVLVVAEVGTDVANTLDAALTTAINAQHALGNTAYSAVDGGSGQVNVTNNRLGNDVVAITNSLTDGTSALGNALNATTGADAATATGNDGITTLGTITLSSSENFTLGGDNLDYAGLSSGSASLTLLSSVDISTVAGSNAAISILDGALSQVSTIRSGLGAIQNRFDSTIANLSTTSENLSAARSRIQDADFAQETAALTRAQILQQAGVSILAQANQLPQNVLALLQ